MASQRSLTSSAVRPAASARCSAVPKTWGLRRRILSASPRTTSSIVNSTGLLGDRRVEVDLQQQVAELLAQVLGVALVDRLGDLVGLLVQEGHQRLVGLLALPGALGPELPHHRDELRRAARPSTTG